MHYMDKSPNIPTGYGTPAGGIRQSDVSHAADTLLRAGNRPTVEKVRTKLGRGSPNTINPMLDAWWKSLSARLDSGPAALHRLPESVVHVAEALWMQALEEGKRRACLEQRDGARLAELDRQRLEVRSHVLTLREGELDARLRHRDQRIADLELKLREAALKLHKREETNSSLQRQLLGLSRDLSALTARQDAALVRRARTRRIVAPAAKRVSARTAVKPRLPRKKRKGRGK
jgi:hypothetical protein